MEGLLVKLLRNGIASNMLSWIKSYLYNHRARVSVDRVHSKKILLRHGVPQGGVLSPALFLLFINDLVSELPKGVKAALYADDLVMRCKEEYTTTATYRMQLAADKLNSWTEKWCVAVNKDKSSTTLFTLSPKQKARTISSMAPQCDQPQQRPTNRPLTRSRTRHFIWSQGRCGLHRSQKWRDSQESTSQSKEGCQEHDAGRNVQVHDKLSHENQARRSH